MARIIRAALTIGVGLAALVGGATTANAADKTHIQPGTAGGGPFAATAPAWAGTVAPAPAAAADETPSVTSLAAEAARNEVLRIAKSGLPAELRTSAWNALRSTLGDVAIEAWLAPGGGYDLAKQRLRDTRTRNRLFCERVVATHTAEFSPWVHAAATSAVKGTDADRSAFVQTGYAQAQQYDREARAADTAHQQEVAQRERDFVRALAENDPGQEVRVAAQWALRPGAVDADVAEFFGYGWATGATLDLEGYRLRISDAETRRHHALTLLIRTAVAAEEALKDAADAAQARAEAQAAWHSVAEHAQTAGQAWEAERLAAAEQAANWQSIAAAAAAGADGIWQNIAGAAEANQGHWTQERLAAAESAAYWQDMLARAQDGEDRVTG
ncbi:hypothetical protein CP967_03905 [Streptomyces nitrosporeus]|uniref:Chemotaxis protein n=1 Tax=Streptomyces nitrosporeus TaxID=28894 RepID=A0A5J6F594_9ACTN|nr:hypothetical protein [Streptomyces nitrosporeus]QEU71213.1 hypothetical protein CP967_03905 [Streptomyces nitrosporeus]GGZ15904.1 hypothetical protein GCM10010327_53570 [Streptomyces nitrosporeus]